MTVDGSGLYAHLRSRACESGEHPVFDLSRFWSSDATCIEAGSLHIVVVYLLFEDANYMSDCLQRLESSLAVDADVYRFTPGNEHAGGHSVALLFSHIAPLLGPMTYGEVQRAVEHYLGWCSNTGKRSVPWKDAQRVTVELVPHTERVEWFKAREKAFSDRSDKGFGLGTGFLCKTPCGMRAIDEPTG